MYRFKCQFKITAMSATSGNGYFDFLGAGTAVIANPDIQWWGYDNTWASSPQSQSGSSNLATNTSVSGGNMFVAATATGIYATVEGMFDVTAGGTIIPSFAMVNAASGQVRIGSFFECWQVGAAGSTVVASGVSGVGWS